MASRAMHCLTYLLLIVPPLLLTVYLLVAFPTPPDALIVHPSLSSLPKHCKSWDIYPEDFYPGGDYVDFPHGRVRYWTMGPQTGQKIVLIHGLSVPALIWKDIAPTLAARGHHVLLYDLYGRGYSDAPRTTYDTRLYTVQLALLMQHVGWNKAAVVGVSMGGAIASTFTATFPQLVENKVALISSTGIIETSDLPRTLKVMSSPIVQKVTSSTPIRKFVQHLTEASPGPFVDPLQEIVRIQAAYLPGFNAAIGSSLRDGPIRGLAPSFRSEAFSGRDVLIIHGTQDTTVPFKYASQIAALLPVGARSELITVPNGGHDLTISHPNLVLDALEKFLLS
ncbi:alpha/beta-hydrolase [Cylindrobasidium torrendii FP15055 ss-10]|uniref:Alpha/beta-hydrolase n=1 Tax=Cylindrobasidium torrendii FP15055 ss-10 TaxID=1314674 RepID=A0A0D7BAI3_9AGAR|nr:alpha/beta-hydrolase [Cylindrobasidium torrendii FP15055 ss-10]